MAIRRAPRPKDNYYHLNKSISEDNRLSWAARGLLVFLLGKPDHWEVSVAHLIKQTKLAAKRSGRDAVYAMLGELEATGYLQRQPLRKKDGLYCGVDYTVSENAAPDTSQPQADLPDSDQPNPANPIQVNNDFKQRLKKTTTTFDQTSEKYPTNNKTKDPITKLKKQTIQGELCDVVRPL